jgi:hypothetical protein
LFRTFILTKVTIRVICCCSSFSNLLEEAGGMQGMSGFWTSTSVVATEEIQNMGLSWKEESLACICGTDNFEKPFDVVWEAGGRSWKVTASVGIVALGICVHRHGKAIEAVMHRYRVLMGDLACSETYFLYAAPPLVHEGCKVVGTSRMKLSTK